MASLDKPVAAQATLPATVRETLEQAGFSTEGLLAALDSELKLEGQFGAAWLVVSPDQLAVLEGATDKELTITRRLALAEIEQLDRLDYFGNTILEARQDGHKEQLLRLPPRKALGFSRELVSINRHIKELRGEDTNQFRLPPVHKPPDLCEKCGQPIIPWIGSCLNCINHAQLLKRLLGLGKPYWLVIAAGLLIMALLEGIQLAQPLIQGQMVDRAITVTPDVTSAVRLDHIALLKWYVLLLLGLRLVALAFGGLRGYLMDWLGEHITYDLRKRLYEHTQRLSLSFYDRKQTGWVMDRITNDAPNLQDFVTWQLPDLLSNSIKLILVPVILLTKNWMLAVLSLLPAPIVILGAWLFMRRIRPAFVRWWGRRSAVYSLLGDVIPGVKVVKAFVQERREAERFESRSKPLMQAGIYVSRLFNMFFPAIDSSTALGELVVLGVGGYMVVMNQNNMTLGTLWAFTGMLWMFYMPLHQLSFLSHRLQRAFTAAQRIFEVLDTEPDIVDKPEALVFEIKGAVTFENVTFGYDPSAPVLRGISFEVKAGEMIGLVGPSGAGKSTTMALLTRFYDVQEGSILVDGVDTRDIGLDCLRSQIAIVPQEPLLFHATVADNIAYGKPGASREEIIRAAKAANAHDFVMRLPEGYDTMVGERGSRVSGGERQRISIARAVLMDPKILILDEATSSVDSETEELIREAIERLIKNRTTFAIAHRLSTLRSADRLIVLEEGKLVEIGSHAELLAKEEGTFKRLVEIQSNLSSIVAVGG